jgi:hypothetical protein
MISCYEREIPPFVETELERLYANIHSSLAFFRQFRPLEDASTYVARKSGRTVAVFLFRCENGKIHVLNEMIAIDEEEICRFARYVFARFRSASVISFQSIHTAIRRLPFPYQQYNDKEDFVIVLPGTPAQYTAGLGKATRSNIKRYSRRVIRNFPSLTHKIYVNNEVEEQHILDIVNLSRSKIEGKKRKFALNKEEAAGLIRLAKTCGFVNVLLIDGRLCAGSISYRIGSNYFAFINAHAPEYEDYWLGMLCYYFTIRESIIRGGKELHMGWGRYEYKNRLLGVRRDFDRLVIYRSYRHVVLNADSAAKTVFDGNLRRLKLWLLDPRRQNGFMSRCAFHSLYIFRKLTQSRKQDSV